VHDSLPSPACVEGDNAERRRRARTARSRCLAGDYLRASRKPRSGRGARNEAVIALRG